MPNHNDLHEDVPITSYEEATHSSNSQHFSVTYPSQHETLLSSDSQSRIPTSRRPIQYRAPYIEDEEHHNEHDTFLTQHRSDGRQTHTEDEEMWREVEELELEEPASNTTRSALGKRISSLSQKLHIPFKIPFRLKLNLQTSEAFCCPKMNVNICIIFARFFFILLIITVLYTLFVSDFFTAGARKTTGQAFDPESLRIYVQTSIDENQIRENLRVLTKADHVAGTQGDYALAHYMHDFFESNSLDDVQIKEYKSYLNYPKKGGRKVDLLKDDGSVAWSAKIDEDQIYTNPYRHQTMAFHGHSKTGDVTGPLIYVNYGSREDFKVLHDSGIDTRGAIALVRNHGVQNDDALKVKAAELAGFAGCLIYSDPSDNGLVKGKTAPTGRSMPEGGVEMGAVSLVGWTVGDVLTPGWASIPGAERIPKENNSALVNIPSIPLSWGDAKNLLAAIQGFGELCLDGWKGGIPEIVYWTGNSSSQKARLLNDQDEIEQQKIWNVLGKINGIEQKEKTIIVGNRRDAWHYGAADPGSGTAVMMEVIRIFGDLVNRGWRPLRTIKFASWDGEAYNLIGSTEWVEDNMEELRKNGYVYLNVDSAVTGTDFRASGSPVFTQSVVEALKRTGDPLKNKTIIELWLERGGKLDSPGARSSYVAFQDMAGISSLDVGFSGDYYPRNSAFDNFEWMDTVGDPGFVYHKILAHIWALLILEYADKLILPFDISAYSSSLTQWVINLDNWVEDKGINRDGKTSWSIEPLREAVLQFSSDSRTFLQWENDWNAIVYSGGGFETAVMAEHRKSHNNRMANFETHLLDLEEGGGVSCLFTNPRP